MDALSAALFVIIFLILGWGSIKALDLSGWLIALFLLISVASFLMFRTPFYALKAAFGFLIVVTFVAMFFIQKTMSHH